MRNLNFMVRLDIWSLMFCRGRESDEWRVPATTRRRYDANASEAKFFSCSKRTLYVAGLGHG